MLKYLPDTDVAKKVAKIAQDWIRSWFFEVESAAEYKFSQRAFYVWLDEQKCVLKEQGVHAIKIYILEKLEPYEHLWLNYTQLYVLGFDQCCTSVGEALHWSMKSGADGVRPSMNADIAANTMMDKAERQLGVDRATRNAAQATTTKLWTNSGTSQDLTKFAEERTDKQWKHSLHCLVMEVSPGVYYVFQPGKIDQSAIGAKC